MKLIPTLITFILLSPIAVADILYLTAGKVLDVVAGKLVNSPALIIEGERVVGVDTQSQLAAPAGATVIDLGGMTIMDMHTHLTSKASEHGYIALKNSIPRQAITGVRNARVTLMAGVTTTRNLGAEGYTDIALMENVSFVTKGGEIINNHKT